MKARILSVPAVCALTLLLSLSAFPLKSARATTPRSADPAGTTEKADGSLSQAVYRLQLFETHRDNSIDVVYRRGGHYVPSAIQRLDFFLRDHLNNREYALNPRLFDLLHAITVKLGRPDAVIDIVCGYRSPQTNRFLREHGGGVARHSLHMEGEAIDIRIPGVPTWKLRNAALALHRGGVGYYPRSGFVHVDVGRVRQWQYP